MTRITLTRRLQRVVRIEAEGHSGYSDAGSDIVCAAVTAAFRLVSAQLDAADIDYKADVDDRRTYLSIASEGADAILAGFAALVRELSEEYPDNISITEVKQNA